jgi:hypothetical protein
MAPQSDGNLNFGNFETPIWESQDKMHLDIGPMGSHRVYYKREGDGFFQVRAMVSLVRSSLPVARPSTKSVPTMH